MTRQDKNRAAVFAAVRQTILPDLEDVAATASVSLPTARKYLAELMAAGLVDRERATGVVRGVSRYLYRVKETP